MAAWNTLYDEVVETRYHYLVGYAMLLSGSKADAEDLVHDALVATFGKPRTLPSVGAAESYVRRAIANGFVDQQRKRARKANAVGKLTSDFDRGALPMDTKIANETTIEGALLQLPPRQRACVALRYMDRLSTKETAAALKISEGSVKRYLSDGVAALNAILDTDDDPAQGEWVDVTPAQEVPHD